MGGSNGQCWRCGAAVMGVERIGRRDACASCGAELHCCRNCRFHRLASHNDCREPLAERQVDKERGNFCEYFSPARPGLPSGSDPAAVTRARLEALFGKRGA